MSDTREQVDQIVSTCKHFCGYGIGNPDKKCSAGINTRALVGGPDLGWIKRAPCSSTNDTEVVCSKREFPTREEAEDEVKERSERMEFTMKAMSRCIHDSEEQGFAIGEDEEDVVGEIECPACGKVLKYSRSSYNGHVWGKCETEGCLQWMQ